MSTARLAGSVKAGKLDPEKAPDINNIMHCASKMFASHGDHGKYYLNEYLSLLAWKKEPAAAPTATDTATAVATATLTSAMQTGLFINFF
jgi:hypothetical protein